MAETAKPKKTVSPGVLALRKVVEDVYADARIAKQEGSRLAGPLQNSPVSSMRPLA